MSKTYYVVTRGNQIGVFQEKRFHKSIKDCPDAEWYEFETLKGAQKWLNKWKVTQSSTSSSSRDSTVASSVNRLPAHNEPTSEKKCTPVKANKSSIEPLVSIPAKTSHFERPSPPTSPKRNPRAPAVAEEPFSTFLDSDFEAPNLPFLADPELVDKIFFSSDETKALSYYGDELLKPITFKALLKLFGKDNKAVINNIRPFAVSNAFYEQIYLFYGFDNFEKDSSGTHKRGDILEAYAAGIVEDMSRSGRGYHEVEDWFFKILALRLRRVVQTETGLYSVGSAHQSLTVIPRTPLRYTAEKNDLWIVGPEFRPRGPKSSPEHKIWSETRHQTRCSKAAEIHNVMLMPWSTDSDGYIASDAIHDFRRYIFQTMRYICYQYRETQQSLASMARAFWAAVKSKLDGLQGIIHDEALIILLRYYRSYVYMKLDDIPSAIEDLRLVLCCSSHHFASKIHKAAIDRLLSLETDMSITVIVHDAHFQAGIAFFGDESLAEWDATDITRRRQNKTQKIRDVGSENGEDMYESMCLD